jgi:hypothetical protein
VLAVKSVSYGPPTVPWPMAVNIAYIPVGRCTCSLLVSAPLVPMLSHVVISQLTVSTCAGYMLVVGIRVVLSTSH